ncbi:MAG: RNA-guided endonuclease InsQ/TnpB family protein, partial [Microcystaceae cyanobacterium]
MRDYLLYQCHRANDLINSAIYHVRQTHFDSCPRKEFFSGDEYRSVFQLRRVKTANYAELCSLFKENHHYKTLGGQLAQQTLKTVSESFTSYNKILSNFFKGEVNRPSMPSYRTKGGLAPLCYPSQAVQFNIETGQCRLPVSQELGEDIKDLIGAKEVWINGCYGIKPEQIKEVRILPKNQELYVEYVYRFGNDGPSCSLDLDPHQALGIDHGINNWLTCVSSLGKSFIIDGRKAKSVNQWYNKRVAELKTGKSQGYWSPELARMTEKRNRFMRDVVNKAARFIINHCLENRIGTIVFGWNEGQKKGANLGSQNNQSFVQIPTGRLKERLRELCDVHGIQFLDTEESYTSKTSFVDNDFLPTFGEKPDRWEPSGKRVKRGQYKTAQGFLINSDCNGAANIMRKVATQLGISLAKVGRAVLNLPKRYDLFSSLKRSYRQRCEA